MTLDNNDKYTHERYMRELQAILDELEGKIPSEGDAEKQTAADEPVPAKDVPDVTETLSGKEVTTGMVPGDNIPGEAVSGEMSSAEPAPYVYEKTKWDIKREAREEKQRKKAERKQLIKEGKLVNNRPLIAAFSSVLAAVLILTGVIVAGMSIVDTQMDKVSKVQVNREALEIDPRVAEELKDYRNILILGIDARDMDDDSNTRSDAMIVASIDKKTNDIRLVSLYRDTYVSLGADYGMDKLTHAYFYGGATQTMRAINRNLDLNCEEVVVVNWKAVADAVDALGGVEINVKKSEISEMNKYIIDTYNNIGGSNKLITKSGKQTLNGNQAVTYARIRKDHASGDHRRNERMKILLAACFNKAKTMSYSDLSDIADDILPQVKTNMSNSQMMELMLDITAYNITDSVSWPYTTMDWTHNGVYYGPPVTLNSNVIQLHEQLFNQPDYEPTETVQKISKQISTLTGRW